MSRAFERVLQAIVKKVDSTLDVSPGIINNITNFIVGTISFGSVLGHCVYAIGTAENKIITISDKYKFNRNGFTEFMIVDDNDNHYNVTNSIWYWKWDSVEDWHKLEKSKEIAIKYYGWRIPLFGLFPNIIMSRQDQVLETDSHYRDIEAEYKKTIHTKDIELETKDKIAKQLNPFYQLLKKQ